MRYCQKASGGECHNSGEERARDGESREHRAGPAIQDFRLRPRWMSLAISLRNAA
jgi:hypothetical protein